MSESLKVFESANLPTPDALLDALANVKESCGSVGGIAIVKYDKTGHFVLGKNGEVVDPESLWAVNVFSFVHGYIAWSEDGELVGEVIGKMTEPLADPGPAPADAQKGWTKQIGFSLKCIEGEEIGVEAKYTTNSKGGIRAVAGIIEEVERQTRKDPSNPIPVVRMVSHSPKDQRTYYDHKNKAYSRVLVPVFEVVDWIGGAPKAAAASAPQIAEPAAVVVEAEVEPERRRRRRVEQDDLAPF